MGNIWIFQASPEDYDLTKEILIGRVDDWELKRFRGDVGEGDTAIIWQSGKNSGIYGLGRLRDMKGTDRINIEYVERLDPPLLKTQLVCDPVLRDLQVIKNYFQANPFSLTADQWEAFEKMRVAEL